MDDGVLASDAQRERVAQWLGIAMEEGRLNLVEYDRRVAGAYAAVTQAHLARLTGDLPPVDQAALDRRSEPGPKSGDSIVLPAWLRSHSRLTILLAGLAIGGLCVAGTRSAALLFVLLFVVAVAGAIGWILRDPFGERDRRT